MSSTPRNTLVALLGASTLALATLLWYEYRVSAERIASAEAEARKHTQDLEERLAAANARAKELEAKLASLGRNRRGAALDGEEGPDAADPTGEEGAPPPPRGRRGARLEELAGLMQNPEFARLLSVQQRSQLDANYAALFKALNLSPAQLSRFKELLSEKQNSFRDVVAAARAQGLDPRQDRDQIRALVGQANAEVDQNIQSLLGEAGYAQYKQYEVTAPQRAVVEQLTNRLSYTQTPLNESQANQLVQILADTTKPADPTRNPGRGGGLANVTDATIKQASGVLTPDQVNALEQIQQEQQARRQLQQILRGTTPPPAASTPPPSG